MSCFGKGINLMYQFFRERNVEQHRFVADFAHVNINQHPVAALKLFIRCPFFGRTGCRNRQGFALKMNFFLPSMRAGDEIIITNTD